MSGKEGKPGEVHEASDELIQDGHLCNTIIKHTKTPISVSV